MRVSNSKLKTWRRCPKQWEYKYVYGLSPKKRELALERGTWLHALLEAYYNGEDWKQLHKILTGEFYQMFEEEREELGEMPTECLRIMRSYLREYRNDLELYNVIDSEMDEIVTLEDGTELQIIVDLILEEKSSGLLWPLDHKTRKTFSDMDSMLLDPQLSLYFKGLQKLGYKRLGGVMYNEIRTKAPTIPKMLKAGGLSKAKNIDTNVYTYMSEIRRLDLDPEDYQEILQHIAINQPDRFFKRTRLPKDPPVTNRLLKEVKWSVQEMIDAEKSGQFPRTFIPHDCNRMCSFRDLCIGELHGSETDALVKLKFETRDKRKNREKRERRRRDRRLAQVKQ